MFEEPKRRHYSYYCSLPIVVTVLLVLVAKLAAMQRADIIADLADRIAHGSTPEATAAVRQLAAMPHPPVTVLVTAAASPDHDIAAEAQCAIGDVLRFCQRRIKTGRDLDDVSERLAVLAAALAQHQELFSAADQVWIGKTARKAVRLANQMPPDVAPELAVHCDAILAAVPTSEVAQTAFVAQPPAPFDPGLARELVASAPVRADVDAAPADEMRSLPLGTQVEELPPAQTDIDTFAALNAGSAPAPASPAASPTVDDWGGVSGDDPGTARDSEPREGRSELLVASDRHDAPAAGWRPQWSNPASPVMTPLPIESVSVRPPASEAVRFGATADSFVHAAPAPPVRSTLVVDTARPLADVHSRSLLKQWNTANDADAPTIEQELIRRGFGKLSDHLVDQFLSEKTADRLRLVDTVLTEPGVGARAWLLLLADDPSADVRLLTVTVMATSNDVALLEKAWQVAIRDRDPRIADLAPRLYERRGGIQRR